jgi:glycosyltransferase involved in cell wall biosynthesis
MIKDFGKISIIVPVYNAEKTLIKCVKSILQQTYKNLEIILINDGSSDNSPYLCDKIALTDSRVKVIHQENSGPSYARNAGLKICTGDYIAFCDSDDSLCNDTLYEKCIYCFIDQDVDSVFFGACIYNEDSLVDQIRFSNELLFVNSKLKCSTIKKIYPLAGFLWNKIWRRSSILVNKDIPHFDISKYAYEDMLWILNNYTYIRRIYTISIIGYNYYIRTNSLSHNKDREIQVTKNGIDAYLLLRDYYYKLNQPKELKATKGMISYIINIKFIVAYKKHDFAMC